MNEYVSFGHNSSMILVKKKKLFYDGLEYDGVDVDLIHSRSVKVSIAPLKYSTLQQKEKSLNWYCPE